MPPVPSDAAPARAPPRVSLVLFDSSATMLRAPCAENGPTRGRFARNARTCQMPLTDNDLLTVPEGRFASLKRDDLLRIVVLCRTSDDPDDQRRARTAWEVLVALDRDRIVTLVKLFRVKGHDARVAP